MHIRARQASKAPSHDEASRSLTRPVPSKYSLDHPLLKLQQSIGNQGVQRLLHSQPVQGLRPSQGGLLQRKCACGGTPGLDGECAECRQKRLRRQRHPTSQPEAAGVPPIVHEVLRSSGQPLDPNTRAFMEPRFGHHFSRVRVHTDGIAAESARAVNALAYTVGRDIVFAAEQYAPQTTKGRRLLAHELAHVAQQTLNLPTTETSTTTSLRISGGRGSAPEAEADRAATAVTNEQPLTAPIKHQGHSVQRQEATEEKQRGCVDGRWRFDYDGCSLPALYSSFLGVTSSENFYSKDNPAGGHDTEFSNSSRTGACDRHDECYQTCHPGSRTACDLQMYNDMKETCNRSSADAFTKRNCLVWAEYYYSGLKFFAGSAFRERQAQVCNCGPANVPTRFRYPDCELLKRKDNNYINWGDYLVRTANPNDPLANYRNFSDVTEFHAFVDSCKLGFVPKLPGLQRPGGESQATEEPNRGWLRMRRKVR
jgi:hypothetical protein